MALQTGPSTPAPATAPPAPANPAGDPAFAVLFPFQAGLALWLVGTGIRLLRR